MPEQAAEEGASGRRLIFSAVAVSADGGRGGKKSMRVSVHPATTAAPPPGAGGLQRS
ncbi:MAG: hypothetical protein RLZZ413_3393 [Pseudomonadota bacterium]